MSDINSHHLLPRTAAAMPQATADKWSRMYGTRHAVPSTLNTFMQMAAARYDNSQAAKPDIPHLLTLKPLAFETASIRPDLSELREVRFRHGTYWNRCLVAQRPQVERVSPESAARHSERYPRKRQNGCRYRIAGSS